MAALVVAGAAVVGVGASRSSTVHDDPASVASFRGPGIGGGVDSGRRAPEDPARKPRKDPPVARDHAPPSLGDAGHVPDGQTVFYDQSPTVVNLDPALLRALRRAAVDAARDGVEMQVNSGWRSPEYQAQLLRDGIAEYGSAEEAARWIATPETSAHVSGDAVDIGPSAAAAWLSRNGAEYGLCQIYENEPWHYELRQVAVEGGCPAMYANPTHDPRMQR